MKNLLCLWNILSYHAEVAVFSILFCGFLIIHSSIFILQKNYLWKTFKWAEWFSQMKKLNFKLKKKIKILFKCNTLQKIFVVAFLVVAMYMGSTVFTFSLVYEKSKKNFVCKKSCLPVENLLCLWNVLSMKCPIHEMSFLWNVRLWNVFLWNFLSLKCPI